MQVDPPDLVLLCYGIRINRRHFVTFLSKVLAFSLILSLFGFVSRRYVLQFFKLNYVSLKLRFKLREQINMCNKMIIRLSRLLQLNVTYIMFRLSVMPFNYYFKASQGFCSRILFLSNAAECDTVYLNYILIENVTLSSPL